MQLGTMMTTTTIEVGQGRVRIALMRTLFARPAVSVMAVAERFPVVHAG